MSVTLSQKLVLNQWVLDLFGCAPVQDKTRPSGFAKLAEHLKDDSLEGIDPEGIHRFCDALRLHLPATGRPTISDDDLLRYDHNIVRVTRAMNEPRIRRGTRPIEWKYFQYLSLLFTEIYLERYFDNPAKLRDEVNTRIHRCNDELTKTKAQRRFHSVNSFPESANPRTQLNKLCFWMATGSGKTLLMHAHIRQYRWHLEQRGRARELNRIILVTPNEGLSRQHLKEFDASGIQAEIFNKAGGSLFSGAVVEILEISKLDDRMGDKTVAVDSLEGNNLVLVDEGHRGLSAGAQGAWIRRRDQLCEEGFSFEYSATFGHAIKGNAKEKREMTNRYARSILFDYSYRWFHGDGFGKDYRIYNLDPKQQDDWRGTYLTAALLTFFQQQCVFERSRDRLRRFGIRRPLWVFVGGSVAKFNEKEASDVVRILRFLNEYVLDRQTATARIRRILSGEFSQISGMSLFDDQFTPLRTEWPGSETRRSDAIYRESLNLLFNAPAGGALHVERLKGTSGELALRIGDNDPFGVINVGDPAKLAKRCDEDGLNVTEREFAGSLFHNLDNEGSGQPKGSWPASSEATGGSQRPVNLLIGARKFTEGWSSWRVSSLGLMHVGTGEGAQIIQLFGRGVRLKGRQGSLKRSSTIPDGIASAPEHIRFLETLQVFGVKANYMANFREILKDADLRTDFTPPFVVPLEVREPAVPLQVIRVKETVTSGDPATAFQRVGPALVLRPPRRSGCSKRNGAGGKTGKGGPSDSDDGSGAHGHKPIRDAIDAHLRRQVPEVNWFPKVRAIHSTGDHDGGPDDKPESSRPFRTHHLVHLDLDRLYFDLQRFKGERGWHNLTISRSLLPTILAGWRDEEPPTWYRLWIPKRAMDFTGHATIRRWQEIALAVLTKYATRYYSAAKQAWEARHLEYRTMASAGSRIDPNYPRLALEHRPPRYGYTIEVEPTGDPLRDKKLRDAIKQLIECVKRGDQESVSFGELEMVDFSGHLYRPLIKAGSKSIRFTPVSLNKGEIDFVRDLRDFCNKHRERLKGCTIHLMRNMSRGHGVHFFEANNFHPDFILWVVGGGRQRIAFIDPKGLVHERPDSPKVELYKGIKQIEERLGDTSVQLDSFIVSVTERHQLHGLWEKHDPLWYAERHIVFQEDGGDRYIREILAGMGVVKGLLDPARRLPGRGFAG